MQALRRLISRFSPSGPHHFCEKWLESIFLAATIKRSTKIDIRRTPDKMMLGVLVHECNGRACECAMHRSMVRIRLIDPSYESMILKVLQERLAEERRTQPTSEAFTINSMGTMLRVAPTLPKNGAPFHILLLLSYVA